MADPLDVPRIQGSNPDPPASDKDQPGYRYAKALCETAKASRGERNNSFTTNWDYLLGKNHWKSASSLAAQQIDTWSYKGVINWCYSTIKTKAAMITSAPNDVFCDPLDDDSTYYDRLLTKSAIEDSFKRVKLDAVKYDAYMWGSVTGVGASMWSMKPDPLTGAMATTLVPIKTQDFYCDPSADSITSPNCRYVVWEPLLDMSTIREMWPTKAPYVKPEVKQVSGGWDYRSDQTDQNLFYGTGGEYSVDRNNVLSSRKARVAFVWIRDESITEDLQRIVTKGEQPGYQCVSCGQSFEADAYPSDGNISQCPLCGGDTENVTIPEQVQENKVISRAYPYGRLIVYSGKTLLFDGENPYEIEGVFPFSVYHHDRIPGDFLGQNDVALLQSLQEAENTVLSMGVDGVVLSMFGPFEYPVGCKSYTDQGNGPKERHPVPDHLAGKARFIPPVGADTQLWNAVLQNIEHQFHIVSGLAPFSGGSGAPVSATEAEITNARLSDRMKGHAQAFSAYLSEIARIGLLMEKQAARMERERLSQMDAPYSGNGIAVQMPDSELKSIMVEFDKLPNVHVRVEVNTVEAIKDKLKGQNSVPIFANPSIMASPFLGTILGGIGYSSNEIREIEEKRGLQQELNPGAPLAPPMPPGADQMPVG